MLEKFFYPSTCGFCGKILDDGYICASCMEKIPFNGFEYIPFQQDSHFDELYCNYIYDGIVRKKILDYKFQHKKYLARTFADGIVYRFQKIKPEFDLIIPVPVHKHRKKERGYNQSEIISKIVSKKIGISCNSKVLVKNKVIATQSKLNKTQRIKNVENVFEIKNGDFLLGKKVLLIDDIYTTGATVNECSRVLKSAGVTKVIVYTIAKATVNSHID